MSDAVHLQGGGTLQGTIRVPGDKSISHRALIFNALANGSATVQGLLDAEDVGATAACLRAMGTSINGDVIVGNSGTFREPGGDLDCGNSGTTIRLLMGMLSGQDFSVRLVGDASLSGRPMQRVTNPLSQMGVRFAQPCLTPPIVMNGGATENISYRSPVASAQVKTALMLAAIQAPGMLDYEEPTCSRDHTERMFRAMGIDFLESNGPDGSHRIQLMGPQTLQARSLEVPGDISSAAFFMVAASIVPGSDILIENVGLNPTRAGVIDVLRRMGADLRIESETDASGEPVGNIRVRSASLKGTIIKGDEIPRLVDELPVLAVAAAEAAGVTRVRDAQELRVKESDRIEATVDILTAMGIQTSTTPDGFTVHGEPGRERASFEARAHGDHRMAMTAVVAALRTHGVTTVHGSSSMQTSYPEFMETLESLRG